MYLNFIVYKEQAKEAKIAKTFETFKTIQSHYQGSSTTKRYTNAVLNVACKCSQTDCHTTEYSKRDFSYSKHAYMFMRIYSRV